MIKRVDSEEKNKYMRTLCMMLYHATVSEFPELTLRIEHSISHGRFCRLLQADGEPVKLTPGNVALLKRRMEKLIEADFPIENRVGSREEAIRIFTDERLFEKVRLLEQTGPDAINYVELDGICDTYLGPVAFRTSETPVFDLRLYKEGMLLLGPSDTNPQQPARPVKQVKMYKSFRQSLEFNKIIGVSSVGELNDAVEREEVGHLINIAEAMHNKLLGRISDDIMHRHKRGGASIVLLAGPSSSGKTTTCKRLAIQLCTNMIRPKMISLDDYFIDRKLTPRDEDGNYDYENLHALDLSLFNRHLNELLEGKEINLPTYSFEYGRRIQKERPLHLGKDEVLLIEGIHGLNPELVSGIDPDSLYKVYVSALTSLRLDNHNMISTSDNRLLRRMVRDHKYRHISPAETLARWDSVRRGEERWIFPYQENADSVFNSSLLFELGVMKDYLEPLLRSVPEDNPNYERARRLADFLGWFLPIPPDQVPSTSLLREFLGGSSFQY